MTISIIFTVALLTALFAIRAGGLFLLSARILSRLAALAIALAHCCTLIDNLIGHTAREGLKLYRMNAKNAMDEVFGR